MVQPNTTAENEEKRGRMYRLTWSLERCAASVGGLLDMSARAWRPRFVAKPFVLSRALLLGFGLLAGDGIDNVTHLDGDGGLSDDVPQTPRGVSAGSRLRPVQRVRCRGTFDRLPATGRLLWRCTRDEMRGKDVPESSGRSWGCRGVHLDTGISPRAIGHQPDGLIVYDRRLNVRVAVTRVA